MAKCKNICINSSEYIALAQLAEELMYKLADIQLNDARHTRNLELMANGCILIQAVSHNLTHFKPHKQATMDNQAVSGQPY